jgi:hypothetical protein
MQHFGGFGVGVVEGAFLAGEAADGGFAGAAEVFEARFYGALSWAWERGLNRLGAYCDWAWSCSWPCGVIRCVRCS